MKKKHLFAFLAALILCATKTYSQSMADVSTLTGSANVSIPLTSIAKGKVALSVSLNYSTNGTKPKDVEGTAGMGFNVQAGGEVSRSVHGLPDDLVDNTNSPVLNGWMTSTGKANIDLFTPANDNNSATCTDETSDLNYINTNLPYNQDTEPDDFYVNAPGLSCHLVYDRATSKFKPVSYQDLVITYTTTGGTGNRASLINSFTITNDKGISYLFEAPESLYQSIQASATPTVFTTKYYQYIHGVYCYTAWHLTKMTDQSGTGLVLTYTTGSPRLSTDPISLYVMVGTTLTPKSIYNVKQTTTPQLLSNITTTDGSVIDGAPFVSFQWTALNSTTQTGQTVISHIFSTSRQIYFTYNQARCVSSIHGYFDRDFLQNVSDQSVPNETPFNYHFEYSGVGYPTTTLPDSSSTELDYWGYYVHNSATSLIPKVRINPSAGLYPRYLAYNASNAGGVYTFATTNGNDRSASTTGTDLGCLTQIVNAMGGTTTITYESNDFLDVTSGQVIKGGGVRVKQITDYDGVSTANNMIRTYSYKGTPSPTTQTSGRPISLPQYAFTQPYTGTATGQAYWDAVTVLSDNDLSDEDNSIVYGYVIMARSGAGYTIYQYNIPATYYDASATPVCSTCSTAEWFPTINNVARSGCTTSSWAVKNDTYSFPFTPNPNYDFERGLIKKVTNYDESSNEVSETNYTYQRSFTPSFITAFRADDNFSTVKSYNKYKIYFGTSELAAQVSSTVFSSPGASGSQTTSTNYTFGSANHKLLTKQSVTNSDGSTINTFYSYTKDYTTTGVNPNVIAINNLNLLNMNLPVETYQQVVRSTPATTVTTSASLTLYAPFTVGALTLYEPSQQKKFVQVATPTSFTPFNTTGGTANADSKYIPVANFNDYNKLGFPQTTDDGFKNYRATIPDLIWNKPVAVFSNASFNEVTFNGFDDDLEATMPSAMTVGGTGSGTYFGAAHNGAGFAMATTQTFSKTISKNLVADNYIFSAWINSASGVNGTLTINLNGVAAGSISFTGNGTSQYYEKKLSVTGLPNSLPISISTNQPILIDDILFYPEVSEAATASYNGAGFKTSQTNTNGVSAYYTNDAWGRVTYLYDKDRNIIQKNTYVTPAQISYYSGNSIFYTSRGQFGQSFVNNLTNFSLPNDFVITSGVTVEWDFGDGTAHVFTAWGSPPSHTYTTTGTRTVTATVTSPVLGVIVHTATVNTVIVPLLYVPLSYTNTTAGNADITTVTFTPTTTGTSYSFTGSQLNTSSVLQGSYTVVVTLSGARHYNGVNGYNSINMGSSCMDWVSSNTYTRTMDLNSVGSLNFSVSPNACSFQQ